MKSLKAEFDKISKKNPYWSSYTCFAYALINQKFNRRTISEGFDKLVEKDDYDKKEKLSIICYLESLTKPPEDNKFKS